MKPDNRLPIEPIASDPADSFAPVAAAHADIDTDRAAAAGADQTTADAAAPEDREAEDHGPLTPPDPPSPAAANLDQSFDLWLTSIEPGWSSNALDSHVQTFLAVVPGVDPLPHEPTIQDYQEWLRARLAELGYDGAFADEFGRLLRDAVTAERGQRQNEQTDFTASHHGHDHHPSDFYALDGTSRNDQGSPIPPEAWGMYRRRGRTATRLSNFVVILDRDLHRHDDVQAERIFEGTLMIQGREERLRIPSTEYAKNDPLRARIYATAGPKAQIYCKMDQLRNAISSLSGNVIRRSLTTNFGWTEDRCAYLVPAGRITAEGFLLADDQSDLRVDLQGEELAQHLGLCPLEPAELDRVKRHVVNDFLGLHDRRVTHALLAAVASAILYRHTQGVGRFALWLTGLTGSGKSFAAQLAMNFFGTFPVASGQFASWTATANFLQRAGYFFQDALFLVDDYKPESTSHPQVVRLLQNYADATGRGRLKSDATANVTRPIRGLLLSTGEDVPEHSASAIARSLVIKVPQAAKDLARGNRCLEECGNYSGVTADFIRHLLAKKRTASFGRFVRALQQRYHNGAAGRQNDLRVAANLALLAAGFVEIAAYLADVWPEWKQAVKWFVQKALPELRDEMLAEAQDQQASEIFLGTLAALITHDQVQLRAVLPGDSKDVIGKRHPDGYYQISTSLAFAAVQKSLRDQGRPPLKVTERTLLDQLRQDGKLLGTDGKPWTPGGNTTKQARLGGGNAKACFATYRSVLVGEVPTAAEAYERAQKQPKVRTVETEELIDSGQSAFGRWSPAPTVEAN